MDLITISLIVYIIVLVVLLYASDYALRRFFGLKVYNTKYIIILMIIFFICTRIASVITKILF